MDATTKLILVKLPVVILFGLPLFVDMSSGDEEVQAGDIAWQPWILFLLVLLDLRLNNVRVSLWFYSLLGVFMGCVLGIPIFALKTPFELNAVTWLMVISPFMLVVWYCWRYRGPREDAREVNPHA